jgi:signal transduction histidine kinase
VNGFSERTGVDGTANVSGEVDGVPFEVQRSILRVAQEALINVHRHAAATRVSLSLDLSENTLRLAVADNGKGYVTATNDGSAASSLGVGIPGMEARIRQFNGTLEIVGGEGGGTTVRATVPLQVDPF